MEKFVSALVAACGLSAGWLTASSVSAQPSETHNYTSFTAIAGTPLHLGYYASINKDCSSAPLPTVRVIAAPRQGTLIVKLGELATQNVAGCPGLTTPARILMYETFKVEADIDHFIYEVTNANGDVGVFDISINIADRPAPASGVTRQ